MQALIERPVFWVHRCSITRSCNRTVVRNAKVKVREVMVIKETRTFRGLLRTIASTAVSGIGHWSRDGQDGATLSLTCLGEDGRKLIAVNQLDDGHVEVFVSSTLEPAQYVIAHAALSRLFIDPEILGEGIDQGFFSKLEPPLLEATQMFESMARCLDGVEISAQGISEGLVELRLSDEYGQSHVLFLVANESGHFCYCRKDIFDLALAMIAAACYQTGFHLFMLSKRTSIHRVEAFIGTQQQEEVITFDIRK